MSFARFERDECAVLAANRAVAARELDAAAENLDDDLTAVAGLAELLVRGEVDHVYSRLGRREQLALTCSADLV